MAKEIIKKITMRPFDFNRSTNFELMVSVGNFLWIIGIHVYSMKTEEIHGKVKKDLEEQCNQEWLRYIGAA